LSADVSEVRAASIIRAMSSFIALMMEAARISETLVDNYFTRQYIPEDKSELQGILILATMHKPAPGPNSLLSKRHGVFPTEGKKVLEHDFISHIHSVPRTTQCGVSD
jgi:hypothetical protein